MDSFLPCVAIRTTYIIELPELFYTIKRQAIKFGVGGKFAASLQRLYDTGPDGSRVHSIDAKFTFTCYFPSSVRFAEVVEKCPEEAAFLAWRPEVSLRQLKAIPGFPDKRGADWVPPWFWGELESMRLELDRIALNVVNELCWRLGLHDGPSSIGSDIGRVLLSGSTGVSRRAPVITVPPIFDIFGEERALPKKLQDVLRATKRLDGAPLHHLLFQEAWRRRGSEPRVAVIMAVAAAETATKNLVALLLPDTEWLLENLPSPPIVTIIQKLLPTLPAKNRFKGKVFVPKEMITAIERGVKIRNHVTHGRREEISIEKAYEFVATVRDFVALTDFYAGHTWAVDLISKETIGRLELQASGINATPTNKPKRRRNT